MTKQTAFLIWLYEREIEHSDNNNTIEYGECDFIREKYMDFFGINYEVSQTMVISENIKEKNQSDE